MKVLSLFDGVSCARLALEKAGIPIEVYYASEIDKYAIKVTQANRPDTIQLGSVTELYPTPNLHNVDLLIGGSPCQDLSIAKKDRKGLEGNRSSLFYEYVRILNEVKPKYFILENVASMPQKDKDIISQTLGVQPVMINASLVSAQNRKRLFWVGRRIDNDNYEQVYVPQPEDKDIWYQDIIGKFDFNYELSEKTKNIIKRNMQKSKQYFRIPNEDLTRIEKISYPSRIKQHFGPSKIPTLTSSMGSGGNNVPVITQGGKIRKLTPIECERLQCMPDNWTNPTGDISNSQRYKMCGNAFNVEVVAHIIKQLK